MPSAPQLFLYTPSMHQIRGQRGTLIAAWTLLAASTLVPPMSLSLDVQLIARDFRPVWDLFRTEATPFGSIPFRIDWPTLALVWLWIALVTVGGMWWWPERPE